MPAHTKSLTATLLDDPELFGKPHGARRIVAVVHDPRDPPLAIA